MKSKNMPMSLNKRIPYNLLLLFTFSYFLLKGINYLLIGSYAPFIFILFYFVIFILFGYRSGKLHRIIIGIWSWLLIIWSAARLLLTLVDKFVKPIPEAHISNQLNIPGFIFSLIMLFTGIYLWKNRKLI